MTRFQFKALTQDDFDLIYYWFQQPTINRWYARNKIWTLDDIKNKYLPRVTGQDNVPSFIIHVDNTPIGFIQYYVLSENLPEGISDYQNSLFKQYDPCDIVGIDFFIANDNHRGKGLGVEIINGFFDEFLNPQFKAVIVDPEKDNAQAIKCYEKAEFKLSNYSTDEKHLIMIKKIDMNHFKIEIVNSDVADSDKIKIRSLEARDIDNIVANFAACHWLKPASTFERYLREQENAERSAWVAFYEDKFAGYVTLRYSSDYQSFKNQNIPEISDLNVLPNYRSKGIGSKLLAVAEQKAAEKCNQVGLGVGLYSDYGMAQRLYFSRGYLPDGKGVTYDDQPVTPGKSYCMDDELILWLIKSLNNGCQ